MTKKSAEILSKIALDKVNVSLKRGPVVSQNTKFNDQTAATQVDLTIRFF